MKSTIKSIVYSLALLAGASLFSGCTTEKPKPANADEARAYIEELRSDYNANKIRVLNQVMKLTADEADRFWPIYRSYEKELGDVGDRKLALIIEFVRLQKAGTLNNENSRALAEQWLQNVQDRLDLWKKYHQKISDAVSPIRAAQFLQVENQMAIFVDLKIASDMPVVGSETK